LSIGEQATKDEARLEALGALTGGWHFSGLRDRGSNIPRFVITI
jgi:hypothetical protein